MLHDTPRRLCECINFSDTEEYCNLAGDFNRGFINIIGMKKFFLVLLFTSVTLMASARRYYTGIGLRAGRFDFGATFKHFYNVDNATGLQFDAFYGIFGSYGYTVKGYYLKQIPFKVPIIQIPLDLVLGGGLHVGYFPAANDNGYRNRSGDYYTNAKGDPISVFVAGVDATVQIEYRIPVKKVPVTITLDANPFFEFYHPGPEWIDLGVALRYVF